MLINLGLSIAAAGIVWLGFYTVGRAISRPGALYHKALEGRPYRYAVLAGFGVVGIGLVIMLVGALLLLATG